MPTQSINPGIDKSMFLEQLRSYQHYLNLAGIEEELDYPQGTLSRAISRQRISDIRFREVHKLLHEIACDMVVRPA